jgi:hypothetical protein
VKAHFSAHDPFIQSNIGLLQQARDATLWRSMV